MSRGEKETGVFWDVEGCPIPDGHGPGTILQSIESALAKEDPRSEVSISGYYEKNGTVDALFWDYYRFGIMLRGVSGDKCGRDFEMLMGIYIWAIDNRPPSSTLMVISNNIVQGTELFGLLGDLKSKGYNVLVAQPDNVSAEWLLLPIHFGSSDLKKRKRRDEERPEEEKRDEEKREKKREKRREKKRREKKRGEEEKLSGRETESS